MSDYRRPPSLSPSSVWRQQFETSRQQAVAWWNERTHQERRLLRVGGAVVAAALVWTLGMQPALRTIARAHEQLPRLHADAAQVDALILEAQALQHSQSGKIDTSDLAGALRATLQRAGLEDTAALTEVHGGADNGPRQWEIVLTNASATHVMQWLASLPYLLQLQTRTVELARANVNGRDRPGQVTGRIVVQQPAERAP